MTRQLRLMSLFAFAADGRVYTITESAMAAHKHRRNRAFAIGVELLAAVSPCANEHDLWSDLGGSVCCDCQGVVGVVA